MQGSRADEQERSRRHKTSGLRHLQDLRAHPDEADKALLATLSAYRAIRPDAPLLIHYRAKA